MRESILNLIDFEKVNILLEGFNKSTGFVTAILDLDGNILSKSGWRQICTEFHRVHPETAKKCTESDTVLAGQMAAGEKYHFYKCHNGLIDVAVPIIVKNEHIANLFSGQFFFKKPNSDFFTDQANKYKFDNTEYLNALDKVPVVSEEKVKTTMDFLLSMTQLISEMTMQKLEQIEVNEKLRISEGKFRALFENMNEGFALHEIIVDENDTPIDYRFLDFNLAFEKLSGMNTEKALGRTAKEILPGIENDPANWIQKYGQVAQTGVEITFENYSEAIGKWFQIHAFQPSENKFAVTFNDITERKVAEEAVLKSNKRFEKIIELTPIPIIITDANKDIEYFNKKFSEVFGYTLQDVTTLEKWWQLVYPDEDYRQLVQESWEAAVSVAFEKNEPIETQEWKFVRKDKQSRIVEFDMLPLGDISIISMNDITDRKQAEEKQKASEDKFRTLVENIPGSTYRCLLDKNWTMLFISNEIENLTGFPASDFLGENPIRTFADIMHPDDRERIWENTKTSIAESIPYINKYRIIDKSGAIHSVYAKGQAIFDNDGIPKYLDGTIFDFTEHKQAEDKLKESEEKFRTLIDEIPSGVFLTDVDGKCNYINPTWSKMGGLSLEEAKGDGWKKGIHPEDRDQVFSNWNKMIKSNGSWGFEYRQFDGVNAYWVDGRAKELKSDGKVIGYLGINTDITERKNNEDILIDSKNRLKAIFNNTKDYQLLVEPETDNNFRIVAVNKSYIKKLYQFGIAINETELIGKPFKETLIKVMFINEVVAGDIVKNYVKVMQTKEQIEFIEDLKINDKNYYAEISLTPVLDVQGDCKYILYNSHDISEKKNAEKELKKHRIHLEKLVMERTKKLDEKNKELESMNNLFVGRELKMVELKEKIRKLESE